MTSVMNSDNITKCRTSPKVVPKTRKTTLPVTQQKQQPRVVPLRDKKELNAQVKRPPVNDAGQSIIDRNDECLKSKSEQNNDKQVRQKKANKNENAVIKEKGKIKIQEKSTTPSRDIEKGGNTTKLPRTANKLSQPATVKTVKQGHTTTVKETRTLTKENSVLQHTDTLPIVTGDSNTRKKITKSIPEAEVSDSRGSKSRSSTPSSVLSTASSANRPTKHVPKTSKDQTISKKRNIPLTRKKDTAIHKVSSSPEQNTDNISNERTSDTDSRLSKEGSVSRSRSNTPGSSVSSESAVSTRTNRSTSSRSSSGTSKASQTSAREKGAKQSSVNTKSIQRTKTFVKNEDASLKTHSYMKTTQSAAHRNASHPMNNSDIKKQNKAGVIRRSTKPASQKSNSSTPKAITPAPSKPNFEVSRTSNETQSISGTKRETLPASETAHKTSRSSDETLPKSETIRSTSLYSTTKRSKSNMSASSVTTTVSKSSDRSECGLKHKASNMSKKGVNKQTTIKSSSSEKLSKMSTQPLRKTPPKELPSESKGITSAKTGFSLSDDKISMKSNFPVMTDTGAKALTSQKVIPGKCSTNTAGRKIVKTDKTLESKLVKSACLQDASKIRSKRSSSKEPELLPSSNVSKSSSTDKCKSALPVSDSQSSRPVNKTRDQGQLKTGATMSAKPEHKSKLIAPLPKNATKSLSKVSKRDSNISDVSRDISKLKSSKSSVVAREELVPQVKVSKIKSETKKCSGESKTGVAMKKLASYTDNRTTEPKIKSASRVGKHDIKPSVSDNSILYPENNKAKDGQKYKDTCSLGAQICDLCSGTRSFSNNSEMFHENRKLCFCSPISQNNMEENNQCRHAEKMEVSEMSCSDEVNKSPGQRGVQNNSRNDSVERNSQLFMDTESADVLVYSEMQMQIHQHVMVDRGDFMDPAVSKHTLSENGSYKRSDYDMDFVDGYYCENSESSVHESVTKISENLDLPNDLCSAKICEKGDNSSDIVATGNNTSYSGVSLINEMAENEGRSCQLVPYGEHISQTYKNEFCCQTNEILSSTDSGFFTNEHSGATSFISSVSKNGEDVLLAMPYATGDICDGNFDQAIKCDNYQDEKCISEGNMISTHTVKVLDDKISKCTAAADDNIAGSDLEISNDAEISPTGPIDKQQNITNILMNAVQDLNSNCLRNMRSETGCVVMLADTDDKAPCYRDPITGASCAQGRDKRQYLQQITTFETNSCEDGKIDLDKRQTSNQILLHFDSQGKGEGIEIDVCRMQTESSNGELGCTKSNDTAWQDFEQCKTNENIYKTSDLSNMQESSSDLDSAIINQECVSCRDDTYTCQSHENETNKNDADKEMFRSDCECRSDRTDYENDKLSNFESKHKTLDMFIENTQNTGKEVYPVCITSQFDSDDVEICKSFENNVEREGSVLKNEINTEMETNALSISDVSQKGYLHATLHSSSDIENIGNLSCTGEIRTSSKQSHSFLDFSTSGDNCNSDEKWFSPGVNSSNMITTVSEENEFSVQLKSTGEFISLLPASPESTCSQTDDSQMLSSNYDSKSQLENIKSQHVSSAEDFSVEYCQRKLSADIDKSLQLESTVSQEIINLKSSNLSSAEETNESSNSFQLQEGSSGYNVECDSNLRSGEITSTETIGESALSNLHSEKLIESRISPELIAPTSHEPKRQDLSEQALSSEKNLTKCADLEINRQSPETINLNLAEEDCLLPTDKPLGLNTHFAGNTQATYASNFQATLRCNRGITQAQNEYDFNKQMSDRGSPLNTSENTLHSGVSLCDVGDQIKNDSTSINMNENLKGYEINDLSSTIDSSETSTAFPAAQSARELNGSRDTCLEYIGDSNTSGVIEINNHIMHQDFFEDQVSGLSVVEHTTQKSSRNLQVYSEKISQPHECSSRDEGHKNLGGYEQHLTLDDTDTCNIISEPWNKSQVFECSPDENKSQIHVHSANYDSSGAKLQSLGEHSTISFESVGTLELEEVCGNYGLIHGAEIIPRYIKETALKQCVVEIVNAKKCNCKLHEDYELKENAEICHNECQVSDFVSDEVTQNLCTTGDERQLSYSQRLENEHPFTQSEEIKNSISLLSETDATQPAAICGLRCSVENLFRYDNEKKHSDSLTHNLCGKLSDETDILQNDVSVTTQPNFQKAQDIDSVGHGCPSVYVQTYAGGLCEDTLFETKKEKFRKSSFDLEDIRLNASELLKTDRSDQFKIIRNKNFESETESGESGSTESGSNTTEIEFGAGCILSNAGEALCESFSPTEVASILDDTSDSYVDATDTLEYDTDGEIGPLSATLLSKDKRISGEFNLFNVCDSTSTESFQDAVEAFEDGRHVIIRSPDILSRRNNTLEDEDSLSQISLPLSDASSDSSTSLENLNIFSEFSDGFCQDEIDNENMEPSVRNRVRAFRSTTVNRSALRHVQTSEYKTKTVLKDNHYRRVANGSWRIDRPSQVETNVLRSTDTDYESGNQIIKNVIYNTGNRIFHSEKIAEHQTAASEDFNCDSSNVVLSGVKFSGDQNLNGEQICVLEVDENLKNDSQFDSDSSDSLTQITKENDSESSICDDKIDNLSVSPDQETSDNMDVSDSKLGQKIETALTIRTERRRQRQRRLRQVTNGASVKIALEQASKPDTQSITQECVERFKQDNVVIYDSTEITLQNSMHIINKSSSVSHVGETLVCKDENIDIEKCKQQEGQSASTLNNFEQNNELSDTTRQIPVLSAVSHKLHDESLIKPDIKSDLISDDNDQLHEGQTNTEVCNDRDEPDGAFISEVCLNVGDNIGESKINEDKIKEESQDDKSSETNQEERTYTFYIQSGKDNDFDDIQFMDEEENGTCDSRSSHDTKRKLSQEIHPSVVNDNTRQDKCSPNASFTIEFSGEEDNSVCQSQNDNNVLINKDLNLNNREQHHGQFESVIDQTITNQQCPKEESVVTVESENITENGKETDIIRQINHGVREVKTDNLQENLPTTTCVVSDDLDHRSVTNHKDMNATSETGDMQNEIIEESNISVKDALKLERLKLEHSIDVKKRIPRTNARRATTEIYLPSKSTSDEISNNSNRTQLKKSVSFRTEKESIDAGEEQLNSNKRVSNICMSFIHKLRPVAKSKSHEEDLKSPTRQRKLMKWVRDNGKWLRVPVSEADERDTIEPGKVKQDYEDFCADLNSPTEAKHCISDDTFVTQNNGHNLAPNENYKNVTKLSGENKETRVDTDENLVSSAAKLQPVSNITDENKPNISEYQSDNGYTVDTDLKTQSNIDESANDLSEMKENIEEGKSFELADDVFCVTTNNEGDNTCIDNSSKICKVADTEQTKSFITQSQSLPTKNANTAAADTNETTDTADENTEVIAIDLSTNVSEARLQRQELLFGIRDNYYRRKHKKVQSEGISKNRRSTKYDDNKSIDERIGSFVHANEKVKNVEQSSDEKKQEDTVQSSNEVPKTIPKLKAVKIQEEIFEGNPDYMKECNKKPSWSETDSDQVNTEDPNKIKRETISDSRPRPLVQIKKSKTFSGIGDFEQTSRECIYVTTSNLSASKTSLNSSQETVVLADTQQDNYGTRSVSDLDKPDVNGSTENKELPKKKEQGTSKVPWFSSSKSRRSREKEKSAAAKATSSDTGIVEDTVVAPTKSEKKRLKLPVFSRAKSLQRPKLLSEIVEVEENKDDVPQNSSAKQKATSSPKHDTKAQKTVPKSNKRRSLSLPTGTLAFGEARIVYKNGHFTIETMDGTEIDSSRPPDPHLERQYSHTQVNTMLVTSDTREITPNSSSARDTTFAQRHHMKRQCAKSYLNRNNSNEDVFYDEDEEIENVSPNSSINERIALRAAKMGQRSKSGVIHEEGNSSQLSETISEFSVLDSMDVDTESDKSLSDRSTSSLSGMTMSEEIVREAQRAKRTSSFRRAQKSGALFITEKAIDIDTDNKDESEQNGETAEEDIAQPNSGFLQKMMGKRKSLNENLTLSSFSKQSESAKEFFGKKMTLKGLFKKNKSDSSVSNPLKTQHPVSPPIAAFQGDDDIGSIDTPPGSPFVQHDARRRHTSADIYTRSFTDANETGDSNCPTPTQERSNMSRQSLSSPSTPSHETNSITSNTSSCALSSREEDQISITSASSATSSVYSVHSPVPLEQPNKPKTPKPKGVGASPRRNPSYSSHLSRTGSVTSQREASNSVTSLESENLDADDVIECKCECEHKVSTLPRQRRFSETAARGSSDSLTMCPYCKQVSGYSENMSGSNIAKLRKRSKSSSRHASSGDASTMQRKDSSGRTSYDKIGVISLTDIASSNSNDSGIQRDAGVNSSNESIKGIPDGAITLRRRKSASPQPERPKSEVGVRWADLDTLEYDEPVKMRQRDQSRRDRPRPKSDFEDNILLFDELFEEVLEDFEAEGSSFLSDRMKAFGSEVDLQPYCSLRNLYEMRRRDMDKQKSRRMSTPHPIKSRMQRVPRKLQKQLPLVRSSSMPESLEKIHKRRKLNHILDFHLDSLNRHMDMDEFMSDDSDLSFDHVSLQEKSVSVQSSHSHLTAMDEEEDNLIFAEALWDHITMDPEELGFRAQDVIEVIDMSDKDWWFGAIDEREGWFPAAFVRLRVNQDQIEEDIDVTLQENLTTSPKLRRISMLNKNQARTNVVNEIISAEREYVKHLKDVVEGYIQHARKRKEMFSDERVLLIFGNIEDIYKFACKFLAQLETCIDVCPHLSEIGQSFLDNEKGFEIYSDYCNNHPSACEELKELCRDSKYKHFFEACRLLQDLVEIPLEGFLLTPVQKICKYPLQLAELLKYTPPDHPDYTKVKDALTAMRKIATLINERKRKMESIEKIAVWQHSVVDWEGSDLLERSSELIFSGDLNKINTAGWSQERYFFLFDHQLIYCKKELLKRHVFSYKGRIDLDQCDVIDIQDGKDTQYNVTVKHAWKLHETRKDKWYLLHAKSVAVKERWLKAFKDERKRVQEDQENDFCMPDHWKQTVLNKVRSQSHLKDKQQSNRGHQGNYQKDYKDFTYSTLPRRIQKQDKKKGWFNFGGGKKSKR